MKKKNNLPITGSNWNLEKKWLSSTNYPYRVVNQHQLIIQLVQPMFEKQEIEIKEQL